MKKRVFAIILIVLAFLVGCTNEKVERVDSGEVTILITRNYGREILAEKTIVPNKNDTIMDLMQDNFDVETAYGGGFINSIKGIASGYTGAGKEGTKMDWFYYINGVMAEVGADQYIANDANTISWDFHDWGGDMYVKTRINAWPSRVNGRKVEIAWSGGFDDEANGIRVAAKNAGGSLTDTDIEAIDMKNLDEDAIFIGTWEDASKNEFIRKAFENRDRAGIYTVFKDEGFFIYNNDGNIIENFEKGAAIVAIQKAYGSEAAVLLIIGNENNLIRQAVDIFLDPESIKGAFGLAVTEDGVYDAP